MSLQESIAKTIEFLGWRKRAFQLLWPGSHRATDVVLRDLSRYCHINEECPHTDPFKVGEWLGRRSVFLRIQRHLYLSPEELFELYSGVRTQTKEN